MPIPLNTAGGLSSAAFNILSAKLPNGQFAVPTPQIIRKSGANVVGMATVSDPLTFNEGQGLASIDYNISPKNTLTLEVVLGSGKSDHPIYQYPSNRRKQSHYRKFNRLRQADDSDHDQSDQ